MMIWRNFKAGASRTLATLNAWRHRSWLSKFAQSHPTLAATIDQVERQHLTYLDRVALTELASAVHSLEQSHLDGEIVEAGCALGGSAIVLAAAKRPLRPLRVYDRFGLIPRPTSEDGPAVARRYAEIVRGEAVGLGGGDYYGYREDLVGAVRDNFHRLGFPLEDNRVQLIEGSFSETLHADGPVSLAHLDCDWYDSVKVCLQRLAPCLVEGGRFVIDDYWHWQGCRKAVDEFLAAEPGFRPTRSRSGRLHLIRRDAR